MKLTGLHILLTYVCTYECDHCFLYCGPMAKGTFTLEQLCELFEQMREVPSINTIYFEGGEPFLFYPLMLEGMKLARRQNYETGLVSNGYWATTPRDAELWLKPLKRLGLADISISDDLFHNDGQSDSAAKNALKAAKKLALPVGAICIDQPSIQVGMEPTQGKGEPVVGGGVMFRGRAAEKLTAGLPKLAASDLTACPHEELEYPSRVHVDALGYVHVCQGVVIGNVWQAPLREILGGYKPSKHPVVGPLIRGGPARLAADFGIASQDGYVDECHYCFYVRRQLLPLFPERLAPPQVYGLT